MRRFGIRQVPNDEYPGVDPSVTLIVDDIGDISEFHMTAEEAFELSEILRFAARVSSKRASRWRKKNTRGTQP